MKDTFSKDVIQKIEENIKDQNENPEWFNHRRGRITASKFSSILSFRYTESTENYISKRVMGTSAVIDTPSVNVGKQNENVAPQLYFVDYKKIIKNLKWTLVVYMLTSCPHSWGLLQMVL